MTLPATVTTRSCADEISLEISVPAALDAFAGHFPGHPVLPGVYQIDWAMQFAALHFGIEQTVASDFQVKFRQVIRPQASLALHLRIDAARRSLAFEYRLGREVASAGKIRLESRP